jgi:hypothetical protein
LKEVFEDDLLPEFLGGEVADGGEGERVDDDDVCDFLILTPAIFTLAISKGRKRFGRLMEEEDERELLKMKSNGVALVYGERLRVISRSDNEKVYRE